MSSPMRVTQGSISRTMLTGLQINLGRLQTLQEQLSSGRQISRPSDNPAGTVAAMQFRSDISRTTQYQRNAEDGMGWLGAADNTLTGSMTLIRRVRDLNISAISGAMSPEARNAIAIEVDQLRENLLAVANTQYLGRPLFGGTSATNPVYVKDASGVVGYAGDSGQVMRTIAAGTTVPVNLDHAAVFGPPGTPASAGPPPTPAVPGTDLFAVLAQLSDDLRNNPAALSGDLDAIDAVMKRVQNALADVGARYHRVETMNDMAKAALDSLNEGLTNTENIDLPKTILDLQMQQVAYQAALGATAKAIQPSLVDFLR